jgi:putative peptidoglycan lipid II flippase
MILLTVFAARFGVVILSVGTVGGVAIECLLLARAVRRMGYPICPIWLGRKNESWRSSEMRSLRRQYVPLAISAIIASACVIVDQSVAGRLGPGRVSALDYGNKLVAVLLAVVAGAVSTAVLPVFSSLVAAQDWARLRRSVLIYSTAITALSIPVTVALAFYSGPLVRMVFEHGAFQPSAAKLVADIQRFAILQAPFAMFLGIATRLTSALSANRLLVWTGAAALLTDIVLDVVFSRWLGVSGIALATPAVQFVSLCVLVLLLLRHEPRVFSGGLS